MQLTLNPDCKENVPILFLYMDRDSINLCCSFDNLIKCSYTFLMMFHILAEICFSFDKSLQIEIEMYKYEFSFKIISKL